MNTNQTANTVTNLLQLLLGYFATKGYISGSDAETVTSLAGGLLVWFIGHNWHASPNSPPSGLSKVSALLLFGALAATVVLSTGCTSVVNSPSGKILSVTERGIGFKVAQSTSSQTPEVLFGFFSSAVVLLPTSTNGPISSPNFAITFDFAQAGALQLGIGENIASGNYQTLTPGQTNSAVATQPVVAK